MADLAILAGCGQHQIILTLGLGGQTQNAISQMGELMVNCAAKGIGILQLMILSVRKNIGHLQLIQSTGLGGSSSRRSILHRQTRIFCGYKQNKVSGRVCAGILHGNAIKFTITVGVLDLNRVFCGGNPAGLAFAQVSTISGIICPLHILVKAQGRLGCTKGDGYRIKRYVHIIKDLPIIPRNHIFGDLSDFCAVNGYSKGNIFHRKYAGRNHSQNHDKGKKRRKQSFLHH